MEYAPTFALSRCFLFLRVTVFDVTGREITGGTPTYQTAKKSENKQNTPILTYFKQNAQC